MTDSAGSTVATATTSTESKETAGCSATAVTSTATAIGGYPDYCSPDNCQVCNLRRELPTGDNARYEIKDTGGVSEQPSLNRNFTLLGRDIPAPDNEYSPKYIDEVYAFADELSETLTVHPESEEKGRSSSKLVRFQSSNVNVKVVGLEGCTSVIVVSREGAWVSHFWESPAFSAEKGRFQSDVINYLMVGRPGGEPGTQPLASVAGIFGVNQNARIFIMTPAVIDRDLRFEYREG